jgi:hypothetical protein
MEDIVTLTDNAKENKLLRVLLATNKWKIGLYSVDVNFHSPYPKIEVSDKYMYNPNYILLHFDEPTWVTSYYEQHKLEVSGQLYVLAALRSTTVQ